MPKDLTFSEVCNFIKNDDGKLIDAVDKLLGAAIICSPAIFGPIALPALGLLASKNGLTSLGKDLLSKITSKDDSDYLARMQRMQISYGLICYTAFFDAIDKEFSEELLKELSLKLTDKLKITSRSQDCKTNEKKANLTLLESNSDEIFNNPLLFPHPTSNFDEIKNNLSDMYARMANSFNEVVEKHLIFESKDEEKATLFLKSIEALPEQAIRCFEAQYFELARKYEEFRIWIQINDRKEMSGYLIKYLELADKTSSQIDIGFNHLHETILSMPDRFHEIEAKKVVEGLKRCYSARINEAVIDDKEIISGDMPPLAFPKISEAFIPQSYRVLKQNSKDMHLEKEETWERLDKKHNLSAFITSFLSSPYSIETPLLILGHPGGGKSLLTKVLSAKLMSHSYTPIRIPLREVNADLTIEAIVEKQIERDAECSINSWADFANQFKDRPLLIILDGFDELLQASGSVFAGFLDKLQKFQQNQIIHNHPARIIVTSRVSLIDKATIPVGTTVLRLLEFNEDQRNSWIEIWNKVNTRFFQSQTPKVKPFILPKNKSNILELAEQPLLLLMLALYDSEENSLHKNTQLDRTVLYDSLLRRFIQRERRRYVEDFDHLIPSLQEKEIDEEMKRLGVAAIGMYNRRTLHVLSSELSKDLNFFCAEKKLKVTKARPLTEADLLLGSFFFIHQSNSGEYEDNFSGNDTAFEFLHNTFGEFLTADFILKFTIQEAETLYFLKQNASLSGELQRKLTDPNGLPNEWFVCLMHSPLYLRPVIPQMIREWSTHLFQAKNFSREKFLESFDEIIKSQIKMILDSKNFPKIMQTESANQFSDMPFLGLIATYTLNLVIIRTVIDENEFVFNEAEYYCEKYEADSEDCGTRPWDKLTKIWRSWFTVENLSGLSAILSATRDGQTVILKGRDEFRARTSSEQLNTIVNVASALADNTIKGLAGLHIKESNSQVPFSLNHLEECLKQEGIDLPLEFLTRRLRVHLSHLRSKNKHHERLIIKGIQLVTSDSQSTNTVIAFLDLIQKAIHLKCLSLECRYKLQKHSLDHLFFKKIINYYPDEVSIEWMRLVNELGISSKSHYNNMFFDDMMRQKDMSLMREHHPAFIIEWMEMMRILGGNRWMDRYGHELFESATKSLDIFQAISNSPDIAIKWMRLVLQYGGNRLVLRKGQDLFERVLTPKDILQLFKHRPELMIEWIQMMQEFDDTSWIKNYSNELLKEIINIRELGRMMEIHSDATINLIKIIKEYVDTPWGDIFGHELQNAIHPIEFSHMMERRPEVAMEWMLMVIEIGGNKLFERHGEELFNRSIYPKSVVRLMNSSPESFIRWLKLMQRFNGVNVNKLLERALRPIEMLQMMEHHPERAMEWMSLEEELELESWLIHFSKFINAATNFNKIASIFFKSQNAALIIIRVMHRTNKHTFIKNNRGRARKDKLSLITSRKFEVSKVPIGYVKDLYWFSKLTENKVLLSELECLML
ncbi:MAG: hypothetical protein OCD00_15775 [Colwellia sp.]